MKTKEQEQSIWKKKNVRWTLGQVMQQKQLGLRRHVAGIENHSHALVIETTWKPANARHRQWPNAYSLSTFETMGYFNHLFFHDYPLLSCQWCRALPTDAGTRNMFVCRSPSSPSFLPRKCIIEKRSRLPCRHMRRLKLVLVMFQLKLNWATLKH